MFITLGFGVCTALASQGGGRVTLEGQIVDSACALDASSAYQLVEFDPLPMGQLIRQGQSLPVIFTLRLIKCSLVRPDSFRPGSYLPDWQHVRVTFDGLADASGRLFAIGGAARGLALRIADTQGQESIPGVPMPLALLTGADQELHYTLQLVGNGRPVAVGSHRTAVRFRLEYF
ncbi:fimbrial protein [Pseudomonas fragi]|nr:fimbrial protein [Pseudomonas fragi]